MHNSCAMHHHIKERAKASLQIPEMKDDLYEQLKFSANKDHRSLAQQAIVLLSEAMRAGKSDFSRRLEALKKIKSQKVEIKSKNISIVELIQEDRRR